MIKGRQFEILTSQQISPHLLCSICREVFFNPVRATCGHTFCGKCLFQWIQTKKNCPLCRRKLERNYTFERDILAQKFVSDLQVKCLRCENWQGTLEMFKQHKQNQCTYKTVNTDIVPVEAIQIGDSDDSSFCFHDQQELALENAESNHIPENQQNNQEKHQQDSTNQINQQATLPQNQQFLTESNQIQEEQTNVQELNQQQQINNNNQIIEQPNQDEKHIENIFQRMNLNENQNEFEQTNKQNLEQVQNQNKIEIKKNKPMRKIIINIKNKNLVKETAQLQTEENLPKQQSIALPEQEQQIINYPQQQIEQSIEQHIEQSNKQSIEQQIEQSNEQQIEQPTDQQVNTQQQLTPEFNEIQQPTQSEIQQPLQTQLEQPIEIDVQQPIEQKTNFLTEQEINLIEQCLIQEPKEQVIQETNQKPVEQEVQQLQLQLQLQQAQQPELQIEQNIQPTQNSTYKSDLEILLEEIKKIKFSCFLPGELENQSTKEPEQKQQQENNTLESNVQLIKDQTQKSIQEQVVEPQDKISDQFFYDFVEVMKNEIIKKLSDSNYCPTL